MYDVLFGANQGAEPDIQVADLLHFDPFIMCSAELVLFNNTQELVGRGYFIF
ncbi:MAG: hypothetical protein U5K51_02275 [Flavobacteriaceae bacterium]|nr:hypothetical protein [Flavobacteriaceae bacterium]